MQDKCASFEEKFEAFLQKFGGKTLCKKALTAKPH